MKKHEDLLEKSGGNPLYLQQLLASDWAQHAAKLPANAASVSTELHTGLRESIARHLDGLSDGCRAVLTEAAMLGREVDFATLSATSAAAAADLLERLDEAVRARVLTKATGGGTYRFRHPLVRDVLYRSVPASERAAMHARIARRLDDRWGDAAEAHAAELSVHYVRALPDGDVERALFMCERAAEQAIARGAHDQAAASYERAREALRHAPGGDRRRIALQLSLAREWQSAGDAERARAAYLDAVTLAHAFRDAEALREATAALG